MRGPNASINWFDRLVAIVYSTVLVVGAVTVIATLAIYFPITGDVAVPMP